MRRLLMVSYHYPPSSSSGVFRPLRLSRYLPRSGWEVTVVTAGSFSPLPRDESLVRYVPAEIRVERTSGGDLGTAWLVLERLGARSVARRAQAWAMLPDDQRCWALLAARRALRLLRRETYHAVLSTSAPYSAHLAGLAIQRRGRLPWVADFRDQWTAHPYLRALYPTRWHLNRNRRMERRVLRRATAVLGVSPTWLEEQRRMVPEEPGEKFHLLSNGYDPEDFPEPPDPPPARFRIVYTGVFYEKDSRRVFFQGLRKAIEAGDVAATDLEVVLAGRGNDVPPQAGLPPGKVRVLGHRPYPEAVGLMRSAAVLFLVVPRDRGKGLQTGKLFSYLAAGRPVLAMASAGNEAAELVERTRSGIRVEIGDPRGVAAALGKLYRLWRAGRALPDQDRRAIREFGADRQAARLAGLLDRLAGAEGTNERSGR